VDVLLVTVTDVETQAVFDAVAAVKKTKPRAQFLGDHTYYHFGEVGGANVSLVKTVVMGTVQQGGSHDTVLDAISELKPSAVIMVGIAFGMDRNTQKIGEILVSEHLQPYEPQKVSTTEEGDVRVITRGERVTAAIRLLSRISNAKLTWQGSNVRFGLVLSGEKLIDNSDFRNTLREFASEAIGGEMEGAGLYAAARKHKVDWILVKAICDWADGKKKYKKNERQKLAARNAASFVVHALTLGGLGPDSA
jgi:nucleoside phosphorylase